MTPSPEEKLHAEYHALVRKMWAHYATIESVAGDEAEMDAWRGTLHDMVQRGRRMEIRWLRFQITKKEATLDQPFEGVDVPDGLPEDLDNG